MKIHIHKYFYTFLAVFLTLPFVVFADDPSPSCEPGEVCPPIVEGGGPTGISNPLGDKTLEGFIQDALGVVRNLGFLVAVFFIVYAGFLFVTARGSEDKLTKAKGAFLWAIVGTAVLLGAWVLATILEGTVNQL